VNLESTLGLVFENLSRLAVHVRSQNLKAWNEIPFPPCNQGQTPPMGVAGKPWHKIAALVVDRRSLDARDNPPNSIRGSKIHYQRTDTGSGKKTKIPFPERLAWDLRCDYYFHVARRFPIHYLKALRDFFQRYSMTSQLPDSHNSGLNCSNGFL